MTYQPFQERKLRVTVNVERAGTPQTYTFVQHRMRIQIREGGAQFGNAIIEIWGVPPLTMNNIARLWASPLTPQNTDSVSVEVWNPVQQQYTGFFTGVISWSAVNGQGLPAVSLVIEANSAMGLLNRTASPYANAGPVALTDALTSILTPAGFTLSYSPSAPPYVLKDARAVGSPFDQCESLLSGFPKLSHYVSLNRLVVRLADAPFSADPVTISPETGMIGMPTYSTSGLQFATIFNPQLTLGTQCKMVTNFDYVDSTLWAIAVMAHTLEPNMPNGQWSTSVAATLGALVTTSTP